MPAGRSGFPPGGFGGNYVSLFFIRGIKEKLLDFRFKLFWLWAGLYLGLSQCVLCGGWRGGATQRKTKLSAKSLCRRVPGPVAGIGGNYKVIFMTKDQYIELTIAERLAKLVNEMQIVASLILEHTNQPEWIKHAHELQGAAKIAEQWAGVITDTVLIP